MNRPPFSPRRHALLSTVLATALACLASGIHAAPPAAPIVDHDTRSRAANDQIYLQRAQEAIAAPLDLADVLARVFKYGLDVRLRQMDNALKDVQEGELAQPERQQALLTSAGYPSRPLPLRPASLMAGRYPMEAAQQLQQTATSHDLLDLALYHYRAKHGTDVQLAYEERRQRAMQTLGSEARAAYWRAYGAQQLNREAEALQLRLQAAFIKVREAESSGGISAAQSLDYQRTLNDLGQAISLQQKEFAGASARLAQLMQAASGSRFELAEASTADLRLPTNMAPLEDALLKARRDLGSNDKTCATGEACRQALLPLAGSLKLDWSADLLNAYMGSSGAELARPISLQAARLLLAGGIERYNDLRLRSEEARSHTLRLTALIQLHLVSQWARQTQAFAARANESALIERRMLAHTLSEQEGQPEAELKILQAQVRVLVTDYQAVCAEGDLQAAHWRLLAALGQEIQPGLAVAAIERRPLADTARPLRDSLAQAQGYPLLAQPATEPLYVHLEYPGSPQVRFEIEGAALTALRNTGFNAQLASGRKDEDNPASQLTLRLKLQGIENGVRPAQWIISLGHGTPGEKESSYNSIVAARPDVASLRALAESGIVSQADTLRKWLATGQ